MAKIDYIVYTEPADLCSGNEVKFFIREFDTETKKGISKDFVKNLDLIIPTFEMPNEDADKLLEECMSNFPGIEFKDKYYSQNKKVLWAYIPNKKLISGRKKEERIKLPSKFLVKTSHSQQIRFYYPQHTLVDIVNGELKLPEKQEKTIVDLDAVLEDKKCALDIETIDYLDDRRREELEKQYKLYKKELRGLKKKDLRKKNASKIKDIEYKIKPIKEELDKERISNVVLNFGDKKYIITTFVPPFKEFKGYKIISVRKDSKEEIDPKKSTDKIKEIVSKLINNEDPLILYGYNIEFDQSKLRDLGEEDNYCPGVDETEPVYKSVQGIKDMKTKGRFTIDNYGYLFFYFNLYENNKLETHARMSGINFTKSLPYEILAYKTKNGEKGSIDDMIECLTYVAEDGETTYALGEKNLKKIMLKSRFVRRDTSTICTTSGKNIMKEYWKKRFFLRMNTLRDRYEHYYKKDNFIIENYKDELLDLNEKKRKTGLFENISVIYPLLFVKVFWDTMLADTVENLRFISAEEKYDSYQTLNEYVCNTIKDYNKYLEKSAKDPAKRRLFNYVLKGEYGVDMNTIETKLKVHSSLFKEILEESGLINYSKKFLYVKDPEKIGERNLGFVFGKGNCLCADQKIISLIEDSQFPRLIYQGLGLSKGKKTYFDVSLMREFLLRRLRFENEDKTIDFLANSIDDLRNGKISKEKLIYSGMYKEKENPEMAIGPGYGYFENEKHPFSTEKFLTLNKKIDYDFYVNNFKRAFEDLIYAGIENTGKIDNLF